MCVGGRYVCVCSHCMYLPPTHIYLPFLSLSISTYIFIYIYRYIKMYCTCIYIYIYILVLSLSIYSLPGDVWRLCVCVCVCVCVCPCVCVSSKSLSHELQKFSSNPISLISRGQPHGEFPPLCRVFMVFTHTHTHTHHRRRIARVWVHEK